jgi:putative transposase
LVLAGIGTLKVRWSRPIQGTIKTVTIHRSADQWDVCFSCVLDVPDPVPPDRPATALDVGLEYFATLADGSHIDNPRYLREAEEALARRQRRLQTKRRGSKNRRRAKVLVAKAHRRIRDKRRDFHHQEARKIVVRHGALAIEGLRIKNMVRNHCLAKSISDAGWNQFLTILTHKAEEAGVVVVVVGPAGTSQVCSGCGRVVPKTLADRWHTCPYEDCGLCLQRDHNSAREILNRARVPARGSPVLGCDPQQNHLDLSMGSVKRGW